MELDRWLEERRAWVEAHLAGSLPPADTHPPRMHEAIRYAVLGGGKRLRPILVLATAELLGRDPAKVLDAAAALELIHASTLVLDDLPAMDDARLRRGREATHLAFGEATAVLAAVALLVHAFDLVAANAEALGVRGDRLARCIHEVSVATGSLGLVGGQHEDLASTGRELNVRALEYIHSHKTGQLFVLAATLGPLLLGAAERDIEALRQYARNLGLAYQVVDDLLDREASSEQTGKDSGKDAGRTTFATLVSPGDARALVDELVGTANGWLRPFGSKSALLVDFADRLARRTS